MTGTRGPKWKVLEDMCLCDSLKTVSIDAITRANQHNGLHWKRIKMEFDDNKFFDKYYSQMQVKRRQKAMST
jgi:hypothetical protein